MGEPRPEYESATFSVAYSNNVLVVRLFEEAGIKVRRSPMFNRDRYERTEIRTLMEERKEWTRPIPVPLSKPSRNTMEPAVPAGPTVPTEPRALD